MPDIEQAVKDQWSLKEIATLLEGETPTTKALNVALYEAVCQERKDLVLLLLDRGADIDMVAGHYGTALAAGAYCGNTEIVSLLLDRGADINILGSSYGTPLTMAAFHGRTDIVSLLLDRGADIDMVAGNYGTALTTAVFFGWTGIVSLVLDRGANINMVGGEYGTALAAAAYLGRIEMVPLLLDRGADIDMVGGQYGTALAAASYQGKMETVSLMLDRGAHINMVFGGYGTALAAAACNGGTDIVLLLLDRGADIDMVGGQYGTALVRAVREQNTDIVSLLLDRGADIDKMGGQHGTALVAAAYYRKIDFVSLLLDRGANIDMVVGGEYGTALTMAVSLRGADIVSLLLDRGANINMVSGKFGTALAVAAYHAKTDIVTMLLDRGANIDMVGVGKYGSALASAAACYWSTDTATILLDRGAEINMVVSSKYGTVLATAACHGGTDMVSLLLDRGANINMIVSGKYGTALAAAACHEAMHTVSLLLDRGASINKVGAGEYGTALAAAACHGGTDMVSLLLDGGAHINMVVAGEYGTAVAAAAFLGRIDTVSLLLERGADIDMMGGQYETALGAAVFKCRKDMVSLLVDRGADINLVSGESGTVLGQAICKGSTDMALFLLELGADVMSVGGSYSTPSGMYPSALDIAHLDGSNTDPTLVAQLQTAIGTRIGPPVDDVISRPPFPMPYTRTVCVNYHKEKGTLPNLQLIIRSEFCSGGKITPEQADVPCQLLGEEALCHSLAALAGVQENPGHQWIQNDVRYFVACNYFDFGLAYAAARVAWKHFNEHSSKDISIHRGRWHKHAQVLDEARLKAIQMDSDGQVQQELIISPYSIMPRRLWDLRSNRVIDFRMLHAAQPTIKTTPKFWAVTHGWTSDMSPVWTSINQHQWPVPLPKDISLEYLRSELLTLGAEYVWIDVLCLRQQGGVSSLEQLRQEEWKLDVPTIGNIYRTATNIVRYFNGLGVRFSNEDWDSPRHWLQRAWTLQEIAAETTTINGGIPRDQDRVKVFLDSPGEYSGKVIKLRSALRPVIQLAAQVDSKHGCEVYELAREMSRRHATQPVDKLSGLFYLLRTTKLPCYDEKKTSEDIWRQCFHLLPPQKKAEVLLNFPYRGSDEQWFPTWAQVIDWPVRDPEYDHTRSQIPLDLIKTTSGEAPLFISNIWAIPDAVLKESDYPGVYEVKIGGLLFGFYQPYLSQKPMSIHDHPVFTLVTPDLGHAYNWVVCKPIDRGQWAGTSIKMGVVAEFKVLKKVGVVRTDSSSELSVGGLIQKIDCLFV